jgi:hypothetical protein
MRPDLAYSGLTTEEVVISETAVIQPEIAQCNDKEIKPILKLH